MIKFNCLIHKETGTLIKYEDWKEHLKNNTVFHWKDKVNKGGIWQYWPKDILFLNDFEIIYNSEFTTDELYSLYGLSGELRGKIEKLILAKKKVAFEYRIEV